TPTVTAEIRTNVPAETPTVTAETRTNVSAETPQQQCCGPSGSFATTLRATDRGDRARVRLERSSPTQRWCREQPALRARSRMRSRTTDAGRRRLDRSLR